MKDSFRVGEWLVRPRNNTIAKSDREVQIEPKAMEVLAYLAQHADEVVTKEEFIEAVWEGAFVSDEALTYPIWELRKALGDDAKKPRFIQTVPKKGYRLIAPVSWEQAEPSGSEKPAPRRWSRWGWTAVAISATIATLVTILVSGPSVPPPRVYPLTSLEGVERHPAISPDGKQVAFAWNEGGGDDFDLYIKLVGGSDPLKLTQADEGDEWPVWSPDGLQIAFLRHLDEHEHALFTIPALGGPEKRLGTVSAFWTGLAWSPDGKFLAVTDGYRAGGTVEPQKIFLISIETGEKTRLTSPPSVPLDNEVGDRDPAFSPDGQMLAFVRQRFVHGEADIYVQSIHGREATRLTFDDTHVGGLGWTPDGKALVFSSGREGPSPNSLATGEFNLWKIALSGGNPIKLTFGNNARTLSVSSSGGRLVYEKSISQRVDIWRVPGPREKGRGLPQKLISSTRKDYLPAYSPDGQRIAFTSDRSGQTQIWVCDSNGSNAVQLTRLQNAAGPRWSPDGRTISFSGQWENEDRDIGVVGVEDGFTRRLTRNPLFDADASWSRDGRWIYFCSNRTGDSRGWKVQSDGGQPVQVTKMDTGYMVESEDRQFLYFSSIAPGEDVVHHDIYRASVNGGEPELVLDKRPHYLDWILWRESIVYINQRGEGGPSIEQFDLQTRKVRKIADLGTDTITFLGLSVSPDGQWILYSKSEEPTSDLVLVENFH